MKKHSKRTIAGAQATKSQRRLRKLRERAGEASKAPTPTDTPETSEATTEPDVRDLASWTMEERKMMGRKLEVVIEYLKASLPPDHPMKGAGAPGNPSTPKLRYPGFE